MIRRKIILIYCLLIFSGGYAQVVTPLQSDFIIRGESCLPEQIHTAWKPWISDKTECSFPAFSDTSGKRRSLAHRKIFKEYLLTQDSGNFQLYAGPLFDFTIAQETGSKDLLYTNTRGFIAGGRVSDKLSFVTTYLESQEKPASWVGDFVRNRNVYPGGGRVKDFRQGSLDYGIASASLAYAPIRQLSIRAGHDKFFIGEGYRSLLLSDAGYNYPFLMFSLDFGRFHYRSMYASLQNFSEPILIQAIQPWYRGYSTKAFTVNYLAYNFSEWMQAGLFESTVWPSGGGTNFPVAAFNPVILFNSFRYSWFLKENVMLGLNVKVSPLRHMHFYGQLVVDDYHPDAEKGYTKNKIAFQAGYKHYLFSSFGTFALLAEYNSATPYTYGHADPLQSYTHYNQALAHPLGANFREIVVKADYSIRRWMVLLKLTHAVTGTDSTGTHWGSNIFLPDNLASNGYLSAGNKTTQGVIRKITTAEFTTSYLVNPKYNLKIVAGCFLYAGKKKDISKNNVLLSFGIKTSLFNLYKDY